MNLKQKIEQDYIQAFKLKTSSYSTLTMLKAAINQVEIDSRKELTDQNILNILEKELKKRLDAVENYQKGERIDLAQKEQAEANIIKSYLPEPFPKEKLKKIIQETITELNGRSLNFGKIMSEVMPKVKGRANGNQIKKILEEMLKTIKT